MPRTKKFTERHVAEAIAKAELEGKPVEVHVFDVSRLYLRANPNGTTRYLHRYTIPKAYRGIRGPRKQNVTEAHVGRPGISLNRAKEVARQYNDYLIDGRDPLEIMHHQRAEEMTFGQLAEQWIEHNKAGWSPKRIQDARNLLLKHGERLANETLIKITPEKIYEALAPLWEANHHDQAQRARLMIEYVLDYAKAKRLRAGENPARWRGGDLKHLFPKRQRAAPKHHGSMPYGQVPTFLRELRTHRGSVAVALEFCILTATRTEETLGAQWSEIDWEQKIWNTPNVVTQTVKKRFRTPLSDRAMELLKRQQERSTAQNCAVGFVFTGNRRDQSLAERTMYFLLRTMVPKGVTVHGFRSSFRGWCSKNKDFGDTEAVEKCLGHAVGNETRQAYDRDDLLDRRRPIMEAWAIYCGG
jgi:integrase